MGVLVSPTSAEAAYLAALQAGIFKTALATTEFRLYQNDITPGAGSVFADFTEADFTGYASAVMAAWITPIIDPISGRSKIYPGPVLFLQSGTAIVNTVYGWYLEDGSSNLLAAGRFDTPVEMDTTGKEIVLIPWVYASGIDGPNAYED